MCTQGVGPPPNQLQTLDDWKKRRGYHVCGGYCRIVLYLDNRIRHSHSLVSGCLLIEIIRNRSLGPRIASHSTHVIQQAI